MTTGESDQERQILPEFLAIAQQHLEHFELDEDGLRVVSEMLARGSSEVLHLPEGPERDDLIATASNRLDSAMGQAEQLLLQADQRYVEVQSLTSVMEGLCPVPPFCFGMGPDGEGGPGLASGSPQDVALPAMETMS